ncbi:hypothetical protein Z950_963 [Sulfitobacter mediterraneus KCTC 32188]|nr:hypothetical protein Z950_963 [Sulfitobacter mediterraneus KCTC 32188]
MTEAQSATCPKLPFSAQTNAGCDLRDAPLSQLNGVAVKFQ